MLVKVAFFDVIMTMHNIFVWNVRGLNSRARRDVVREFILQQHVSVVCLVETKLDVIRPSVACDLMGSSFDYVFLPSVGVAGGILIGWRRDLWSVQRQIMRRFSVTVDIQSLVSAQPTWSLATVYGPVDDELKAEFLEELWEIHADCPTPLLLCGDFNLIYQAADKSNDRLNIRSMRRFRRVIDDLQLEELYLHGRLYTWSNERRHPTLERIDRAFGSLLWIQQFTDHHMRSLSTDSSDHAPLLLRLATQLRPKPRFRFECLWPKMDGFLDVVQQAWSCNLDSIDACKTIDFKLRRTAKALKSCSMRKICSVRLELFMVRELIAQLDVAQDTRELSIEENDLRKGLKRQSLGLASLSRTIARQRSRIRFLEEGDANTKFFHLQACHRKRKSYIPFFQHDGQCFSAEEAKEDLLFDYYNSIFGTPFSRTHELHLQGLLPQLELSGIDACFSEAEVWATIRELPLDRAPGPDGFTGRFYRDAWDIIKDDIVNAFNALWSLDARSFHLLNGAQMVLLRKTQSPTRLQDYRPISLIHSFSKLFAKCLARRLAPYLKDIVALNQSAFIKDRSIHDNFCSVQLACRWLHSKKFATVLLKVDIAKAFDSVAWNFLLEVLQFIGFPRRWREWIAILLSTASTKVLLNGRPGRRIAHARGLRQGDPISPMLFVIVMEVLNSLIRAADQHMMLTPLPGTAIAHRASLYADDLVVLLAPTVPDLRCFRQILMLFAGASGLVTNMEKCALTPIQCSEEMIHTALQEFPCVLASFPCRYLGIPLSLPRLRRADELAVIDSIAARIPTWKAGLLTSAGRVLLTKVTLSAIPVHLSIACCLSQWAIQQIDKRRRAFLWVGAEDVSGGKCKVAWNMVSRPTHLGGLGVLDMRYFGLALRLRWEWLRRSDPSRSWAALPAKADKHVQAMSTARISVVVGDGVSTKLWTDNWTSVGPLCHFRTGSVRSCVAPL